MSDNSTRPPEGVPSSALAFLTIGHSTRPIEDFIELLRRHAVAHVADVRSLPRSRRHPQFNRDPLSVHLGRAGIGYTHFPELGGLRLPRPDSLNTGWRNAGFIGYADYMQTDEFERGLEALMSMGRASRTAFMCAESLPWRCHRNLISDALVVRRVRVDHILSASSLGAHRLTPWAHVEGSRVLYPPAEQPSLDFRDP